MVLMGINRIMVTGCHMKRYCCYKGRLYVVRSSPLTPPPFKSQERTCPLFWKPVYPDGISSFTGSQSSLALMAVCPQFLH